MKVRLEFETDNADFEDNLDGTLDRIFAKSKEYTVMALTSQVCGGASVLDLNGNKVGWISVVEK